MNWFRLLISSLCLTILLWLTGTTLSFKEQNLPPLGAFFSPYHGFWQNADRIEATSLQLDLTNPNLDGPVSVYFDKELIPRIFATSDKDAAFAQGYISAYLRLFQMDISARAPVGRLSEIVGERTLQRDLMQRRKGLAEAAERLGAHWLTDPEVEPIITGYIHGINTRINEMTAASLPLEYKILNAKPEIWTPTHCAAFYLAMSETLARTAHDLPLSNAFKLVGQEDFDLLYPNRNPFDIPVIPADSSSIPPLELPAIAPAQYGFIHPDIGLYPSDPGIGSNNWAVDASLTASGYPILCNDPHLELTLPSIWLEMQITTPQYSAYGVAFTSLPGISIGFNESIAWGFTNAGHDVLDWYTIQWTDNTRTTYLVGDSVKTAILRPEYIYVRGRKAPVIDTIRITHYGPVAYTDTLFHNSDLAMQWLPALNGDTQLSLAFIQINKAKNLHDWLKPIMRYDAPMQNALFASRSGDIALRVSGRMPIRNHGSGRLIYNGADPSAFWSGFVPPDENPMIVNPIQNYIASANQQSTSANFPRYYTGIFEDWRGIRINQLLRRNKELTVADMMAFQNDNTSLEARTGLAVIDSLMNLENLTASAQDLYNRKIKTWDGIYHADKDSPILYERWKINLDSLAWDELTAHKQIEIPERWRTFQLLIEKPELSWWDIQSTPEKEDAATIISIAFDIACQQYIQITKEHGIDKWSLYNNTFIRHLARMEPFSYGNLGTGGHPTALNALNATNGPSWRMIAELGPTIQTSGIYPGGQSGNPGSPFYDNFIPIWAQGKYRSLKMMTREEAAAESKLISIQFTPSKA